MKRITVRNCTLDDLEAVYKVDREAFGVQCFPSSFLRQAIDVFGDLLQVAVDAEGRIAGYTLGALQTGNSSGWILALAVEATHRCRGIAKALTERIIQVLADKGAQDVLLTVDPDNRAALKLYQRSNFCEIDRKEDYFGPGETRIVMQRRII